MSCPLPPIKPGVKVRTSSRFQGNSLGNPGHVDLVRPVSPAATTIGKHLCGAQPVGLEEGSDRLLLDHEPLGFSPSPSPPPVVVPNAVNTSALARLQPPVSWSGPIGTGMLPSKSNPALRLATCSVKKSRRAQARIRRASCPREQALHVALEDLQLIEIGGGNAFRNLGRDNPSPDAAARR